MFSLPKTVFTLLVQWTFWNSVWSSSYQLPFFFFCCIPANMSSYYTSVFVYISCNTLNWGVHDRYALGWKNSSASLNRLQGCFFFLDTFILKSVSFHMLPMLGVWCAAAWAVSVSITCNLILFGNNCTSDFNITKSATTCAFSFTL